MMRSIFSLSSSCLVAGVLLVSGCSSQEEGASTGSNDEDLTQFGGTALTSPDGALSIKLESFDGKSSRTKEKRFIKASVSRAGKRFSMWCDVRGRAVAGAPLETVVTCTKSANTVSDDDNEVVSFSVTRRDEAGGPSFQFDAEYGGDYTFLANEAQILLGDLDAVSGVAFKATKQGTSANKDPFAFGAKVHEGFSGLMGQKFFSQQCGVEAPVTGYTFFPDDKLATTLHVTFGNTAMSQLLGNRVVSLLVKPGSLASGLADKTTVFERALSAFDR